MGVFDFLKGGRQPSGDRAEPETNKETRTYDELLDEIMEWNTAHTDILDVLRKELKEERLANWSQALEKGVRRGLASSSGKVEESSLYPVFLDLYQFINRLRTQLLVDPTMKNVWKMEKTDPLSVCIICGIRALQKEGGARTMLNTLHWILLERYLKVSKD